MLKRFSTRGRKQRIHVLAEEKYFPATWLRRKIQKEKIELLKKASLLYVCVHTTAFHFQSPKFRGPPTWESFPYSLQTYFFHRFYAPTQKHKKQSIILGPLIDYLIASCLFEKSAAISEA